MMHQDLRVQIEAVRRFNRFYTKQIGLLNKALLHSSFSLTEARVLYELAQHEGATATELCDALGLDAGYLSRMLQNFKKKGLLMKQHSKTDGRQSILSLTEKGKEAFNKLNNSSQKEIQKMLDDLTIIERSRLTKSMFSIENLLNPLSSDKKNYLLRDPYPGDMGWVIQAHGLLYTQEYHWDEQFETLVAEIVVDFMKNYNPKQEKCWIAEIDGEPVGSVFLVKSSDEVAKLRLLLIDPKARGLGIGGRLVEECIRFARRVGYRKITLWTNHVLLAARHIYEKVGFQLIKEESHHSFGHDLIGETWELEL